MKPSKKPAPRPTKTAKPPAQKSKQVFTPEERDAMRERAREMKSAKGDGESEVLAKLAALPQPERAMAERLHALITASVPALAPKTWYGMPAYAKDDKVVCFFQSAHRFKTRYATFGFSDKAKLDDGQMWPTAYALKALGAAEEAKIVALLKKAVG